MCLILEKYQRVGTLTLWLLFHLLLDPLLNYNRSKLVEDNWVQFFSQCFFFKFLWWNLTATKVKWWPQQHLHTAPRCYRPHHDVHLQAWPARDCGGQAKSNTGLCGLLPLYNLCPTLYLTRRHFKEQGVRGAEHPIPGHCELLLVCTPSDCHLLGSCKESYYLNQLQ